MRSARNMLRAAASGSSGGGGGGGSTVLNATFTGPDSTSVVPNADTGQVWHTDSGTWGIVGNQLYRPGGGVADCHGYYDAGVSDYTASTTLTVVDTSACLCFRYQDENNHFILGPGAGNQYAIYKRTAGSYVAQWTGGPVAANGDILRVTVSGTSIQAYTNGILRTTLTSSSFQTASKVGFRALGGTCRFDSLLVTVP